MKKYLVIGIIFLLFQAIATYQNIENGFELDSIGKAIGFFIPGIIGIASLVKYFKNKKED